MLNSNSEESHAAPEQLGHTVAYNQQDAVVAGFDAHPQLMAGQVAKVELWPGWEFALLQTVFNPVQKEHEQASANGSSGRRRARGPTNIPRSQGAPNIQGLLWLILSREML